ncbi:MAG TPA: 3'-5' exonuclease, partial [Candidatus Saccharimonas sp.]|nr:3'-5' exonuclease [Candidatus Saccharimonas sp.]
MPAGKAAGNGIWERPLAFVDIETTGSGPHNSRVLELGVVRVEQGRVAAELRTLVDPGEPVPSWITRLTGIRDDDVAGAPTFAAVADELAEVLDGAV